MRINIGTPERLARLILGVVLLFVAILAGLSPLWSWILGLAGAVLVITGALRFCPIWAILGISTGRRRE